MNELQLARAIDGIATGDPERLGHGYTNTQFAWRHAPAIDLPRQVALEVVGRLRHLGRAPSVLLVGRCGGGGLPLAVARFARQVVLVAPGWPEAEAVGYRAPHLVVAGDPDDEAVAAEVGDLLPVCDAVLLDADGDGERLERLWRRYAARVRPGGFVLLVDRAQAAPDLGAGRGTDEWIATLRRNALVPADVRLERFGAATAVFAYQQPMGGVEAWCSGATLARRDEAARSDVAGFRLSRLGARWFAVPADEPAPSAQSLWRNAHGVVLTAADPDGLAALARAFAGAEPALDTARTELAAGRATAASARIRAVAAASPELARGLGACVEAAPWNRRLLLALGTLWLGEGMAREGVALLRKALRIQMGDSALLAAIATACLDLLHDEVTARDVLATVRAHVRERRVAEVCRGQHDGNLLWQFPQLLEGVRSVVHVGAGRGDGIAPWTQLEMAESTFVEAHPDLAGELARRVSGAGSTTRAVRVVNAALGATAGPGTLRWGRDPLGASLLRQHPLSPAATTDRQNHESAVAVTTLDGLLARGELRPEACELLHLDVEGAELDVLRGAVQSLQHVRLVSVIVCLAPLYADAPLPQQIQTFLYDDVGEPGFGLCAFEAQPDGRRGQMLFRRLEGD